jgi:hypothetical protein
VRLLLSNWPDVDIDLAVKSIEHAERFPLARTLERRLEPPRHDTEQDAKTKPAAPETQASTRQVERGINAVSLAS